MNEVMLLFNKSFLIILYIFSSIWKIYSLPFSFLLLALAEWTLSFVYMMFFTQENRIIIPFEANACPSAVFDSICLTT